MADVNEFWSAARSAAGIGRLSVVTGETAASAVPPQAYALGSNAKESDELLELVLTGRKTATASAVWSYEAAGEPLPEVGDLAILLDGGGRPRALVRTTDVRVVPFSEVDAAHAAAEGEGDGSLEAWRRKHEAFFAAELTARGRHFDPALPVVLERFRLLHPRVQPVSAGAGLVPQPG